MNVSPRQPRLGSAALVVDNGRLLLAQSAKTAIHGLWVIPGGGVEFGEEWKQAAVREIRHETGLTIELVDSKPSYVADIISPDDHRVVLYTPARLVGSAEMTLDAELLDAGFFSPQEITAKINAGMVTKAVGKVLTDLCWTV